jgi:hypothetical protein
MRVAMVETCRERAVISKISVMGMMVKSKK